MIPLSTLRTNVLAKIGEATNRTIVLPLLFFSPTSRCNSRCVSCDWWRHTGEDDLDLTEIDGVIGALSTLGTRLVVFTGGEPLLRSDVFEIAARFRAAGPRLWLLTSGVALARHAQPVARLFDRVTLSLDAADSERYREIRGIDALAAVEAGVAALKAVRPGLRITARATLHRMNFREMPHIIDHARRIGLDAVSFLAADVSSRAFGRTNGHHVETSLLPTSEEIREFADVVETAAVDRAGLFSSAFIEESPARLRRLPAYYAAMQGQATFPPVTCNAPWVSAVVEANGDVRPCFFHARVGNIRERSLREIVQRDLPAFRATLDVATNATCQRCVCSLRFGLRSRL